MPRPSFAVYAKEGGAFDLLEISISRPLPALIQNYSSVFALSLRA